MRTHNTFTNDVSNLCLFQLQLSHCLSNVGHGRSSIMFAERVNFLRRQIAKWKKMSLSYVDEE